MAPAGIDGISFVPTLTGSGTQRNHSYLFWTWDGIGTGGSTPHNNWIQDDDPAYLTKAPISAGYGVRSGNWKGIVPYCSKATNAPSMDDLATMQLFDLSSDPFETTNVAAAHPDVVEQIVGTVVAADLSCDCYQC